MTNLIQSLLAAVRDAGKKAPRPAPDAAPPFSSLLVSRLVPALRSRDPNREPTIPAIEDFGENPGDLIMRLYVPPRPRRRPALVVVMHGCKQTVNGYDKGSGWSKLADRGGFLLLYPEQQSRNNAGRCFNWYSPDDTKRGSGEAASIRAMIAKAVANHSVDTSRIFVCGLSAGGAMTGVMLAAYPEIFKAGAIIAGLPYGGATSTNEALESMFTGKVNRPRTWGDFVRDASDYRGPWPNVAVWHGSADAVVKPVNAGEIVKQWTDVHGIGDQTPVSEEFGVVTRRTWRDARGRPRVLEYMIPGMGHGAPVLDSAEGNDGVAGPFFLISGLWSSLKIAQDWGLFDQNGKPPRAGRLPFLSLRH